MRAWLVALGLGGSLLLAGAAGQVLTSEQEAPMPDVVMRMPLEGDTGRVAEARSFLPDPHGRSENTSEILTWSMRDLTLPDGSPIRLPSLHVAAESAEGSASNEAAVPLPLLRVPPFPVLADGDGEVIASVSTHTLHHAHLPDAPVAWSGTWFHHEREGSRQALFEHAFVHVFQDVEMCSWMSGSSLVGLGAVAAEAAVRTCYTRDLPEGSTFTASHGWEQHPQWGLVWTFRGEILGTNDDGSAVRRTMLLRTSPAASIPVEERDTLEFEVEGFPSLWTFTRDLTGWRDGSLALDAGPFVIPDMPTVPLVPYGPLGPVEGDLSRFPLGEARDAVARTPDGATFFAEEREIILQAASFVEQEPGILPRANANGVECGDGMDGGSSSLLPPEAGALQWSLSFASRDESVWGHAETRRATRENALALRAPVAVATAFRADGGSPLTPADMPDQGPDLDALWDMRTLADAFYNEGSYVLELSPSFVVVDEHDAVNDVAVTRVRCTFVDLTGMWVTEEGGVTFDDGVATTGWRFLWIMEFDSHGAPITLGEPERTGPPPGPPLPAGLLAAAGVTLVATGAAASPAAMRFLPGFYTRLSAKQVLAHPERARVLGAVRAKPGRNVKDLSATLGVHRSSTTHHLRMLERLAFVTLVRTPAGLAAFPVGDPAAKRAHVLAKAHAQDLVAFVRAHPGATMSDIARALDLPKARTSTLVSELAEAGLVAKQRAGREVRVTSISDG